MKLLPLMLYDLGVTGIIASLSCLLFGLNAWQPVLAAWLACMMTLAVCVITMAGKKWK